MPIALNLQISCLLKKGNQMIFLRGLEERLQLLVRLSLSLSLSLVRSFVRSFVRIKPTKPTNQSVIWYVRYRSKSVLR